MFCPRIRHPAYRTGQVVGPARTSTFAQLPLTQKSDSLLHRTGVNFGGRDLLCQKINLAVIDVQAVGRSDVIQDLANDAEITRKVVLVQHLPSTAQMADTQRLQKEVPSPNALRNSLREDRPASQLELSLWAKFLCVPSNPAGEVAFSPCQTARRKELEFVQPLSDDAVALSGETSRHHHSQHLAFAECCQPRLAPYQPIIEGESVLPSLTTMPKVVARTAESLQILTDRRSALTSGDDVVASQILL